MSPTLFTRTLAGAATAVALSVAPMAAQAHHHGQDIVDVAVAAGSFETLVAAVQAADLVDVLKSDGPFTVFAPTDEAFAKLPAGTVESLLLPENKDALVSVLTYHVVAGEVLSRQLIGSALDAETVQGETVAIDATKGGVRVNTATVIAADVAASNGVIHVIDEVLLPANFAASQSNIVETAAGAGVFNTLLAAATAAGLADELTGTGPFTVFAPTDRAFAHLPAGTVQSLLRPENRAQLLKILGYHIVPGAITSDQLAGKRLEADTLFGRKLPINATGGGVHVDNARVTQADIQASNGVIHVINRVMIP